MFSKVLSHQATCQGEESGVTGWYMDNFYYSSSSSVTQKELTPQIKYSITSLFIFAPLFFMTTKNLDPISVSKFSHLSGLKSF